MLLLAAGAARRFGSDKRRARTATGSTVLATSIVRYRSLGWPLYVVLRQGEQSLQEQITAELNDQTGHSDRGDGSAASAPLHWLQASDAAQGMGHTLRCGVAALQAAHVHRAIVALADMPYVQSSTLQSLAQLLTDATTPDQIVRPRYQGQPGNPVGFSGAMLSALATAGGDAGARPLLAAQAAHIRWLPVEDAGVLQDIDRPADLRAEANEP